MPLYIKTGYIFKKGYFLCLAPEITCSEKNRIRHLGYERVHLPLIVADAPFHIQGDDYVCQSSDYSWVNIFSVGVNIFSVGVNLFSVGQIVNQI